MLKRLLLILFLIFLLSLYLYKNTKGNVVEKVIDGDTIKLSSGKEIRLLGIDAPEKDQLYYKEAKNFLEDLIFGKEIILESDVTDRDKYGRYLRYVFFKGIFVNLEMVKRGYARVLIILPDVKYYDVLVKAEEEARTNRRGIWSTN